ncbi:MAG: prolyl oligopeptidase family serine peptidase [Bacteroidetes bacterium]|nr:prolyl oligopeptidase family serine peptidase [Bacteroidota bacterium]
MKKTSTLTLLLLLAFNSHAEKIGPWDLDMLFQVPKWEKTDMAAQPGMTGILYESIPMEGKRVQVFAYYSAPEGPAPGGGWPAVVCVHGGGGTAFNEWVRKWNDHGFAAISMDLEGHFPMRKPGEKRGPRIPTAYPGPGRVGVFDDFDLAIEQQWYYHAVAQVILAHSLIRSFPEVNSEKTGITGISWGGTLTSTNMGVDKRYKFAIPVYGCGFLPDSDGHQGDAIKAGKHSKVVNKYYDGSAYFSNVSFPTLWVNGTNDKHFSMPATQESSRSVKGPAILRFQLRMKHGHYPGWEPEEIYAFAKSIVTESEPLVKFSKPQIHGSEASVLYTSSKKVTKAEILYTTETGIWNQRKWERAPAAISGTNITASIPEGASSIYFAATDDCNLMVSSEYIEIDN